MIWIRLKLDLLPIIAQEIEKICQEYMDLIEEVRAGNKQSYKKVILLQANIRIRIEELEQFYDENYADYRIGYFEKLKLKLRKVLSPQIDVNRMIYDETQGLKKQKKLKDQQKSQVQVQIVNNTKSSQKQLKEMGQESYQQSVQNSSPRKIAQSKESEYQDQHRGSEKHKVQRNKEQQNQIQQSQTPEKQIKSNIQINKNATNYQKQQDSKKQISQTQSSNRQTVGDRSSKSPYRQTIHSQNRQNQKQNLQQAPSKSPNKTIEKNKIISKNQTQKNLQQTPNSTSRKTLQSDLKSKTQTNIKKALPHQLQENKNQRENKNIIYKSKYFDNQSQNFVQQQQQNLQQNEQQQQDDLVFTIRMSKEEYLQYLQAKQ